MVYGLFKYIKMISLKTEVLTVILVSPMSFSVPHFQNCFRSLFPLAHKEWLKNSNANFSWLKILAVLVTCFGFFFVPCLLYSLGLCACVKEGHIHVV